MIMLIAIVFFGFCLAGQAKAIDKLAQEAANVLNKEISQDPANRIPEELVKNAKCIIVYPNVIKAGFIISGHHGDGLMSCRHDKTGEWGAPAFYDITGTNIGLNIGGASGDVIMLVMDRNGENAILSGATTLGSGRVMSAKGVTGYNADVRNMKASIITYVHPTGGLYAGIELGGTSISFDKGDNTKAYGKEMTPLQTVSEQKEIPSQLMVFNEALNKIAPKHQLEISPMGQETPAP
jgi:lipid-binding SYLF domain-containing protein